MLSDSYSRYSILVSPKELSEDEEETIQRQEVNKKVIEQFDREPFTKTFAVNHTTPAEMANMICNVLLPSRGISATETSSAGGATGFAADMGAGSGSSLKLGEGIVACSISASTAANVVEKYGFDKLKEIAKFNFKNTDRILHTLVF